MISWTDFWLFALPAFCCWLAGAWFAWRGNRIAKACGFTLAGLLIFAAFIIGLWVSLERPPMRTMGETRLWYSFFFLWWVL
jgi:respiratory nitrite reductase specific cytochrome c biogenesis protein NrfM